MQELVELEEQGWRALATEGDAGKAFYAGVLREDAVMLFPGGIRLDGKQRILESLDVQPWQWFRFENPGVISLTPDAATVAYQVTAQRGGDPPYVALVGSTYVRDGSWQLVFHQQTPV
jgi:hypothetical protein